MDLQIGPSQREVCSNVNLVSACLLVNFALSVTIIIVALKKAIAKEVICMISARPLLFWSLALAIDDNAQPLHCIVFLTLSVYYYSLPGPSSKHFIVQSNLTWLIELLNFYSHLHVLCVVVHRHTHQILPISPFLHLLAALNYSLILRRHHLLRKAQL